MFASFALKSLAWLLLPLQIFGASPHPAPTHAPAPGFPPNGPVAETQVCGTTAAPPARYQHVIWILEENQNLHDVIGAKKAPFLTSLSRQCAYSTHFADNEPHSAFGRGYHSVGHYIADLSGSNCVTGNARTGAGCLSDRTANIPLHPLSTTSLFEQITAAGGSWRSFQESSPHNCTLKNYVTYAPRHDGALYFSRLRSDCAQYDQPIPTMTSHPTGPFIDAVKADSLPTFTYVTPNLKNDMHSGSVARGDAWLRAYLEPVIQSQSYQSGNTAVFIIWDEAAKSGQPLPNLVLAKSAHTGHVSDTINGFSVLGATESMLGLPKLGCATGTPPGRVGTCFPGAGTNLRQLLNI